MALPAQPAGAAGSCAHFFKSARPAGIDLEKLVVLRMRTDPEQHDIFTVHSAQGAIPEADRRRVDKVFVVDPLKWSPGWEGFRLKRW